MICPSCGCDTRVYGTKKSFINTRFRICTACGLRFLTKEVVAEDSLSKEYNNYLEDIGELDKNIRDKANKLF